MVYQPMLEVLGYLRANGFKTYIVSGGGVEFMRPWTERVYGVPPEQVVGSRVKVKYEVRNGTPVLLKLPQVDLIDDKAGKPVGINQVIGRRPIAAFGNSDGDFQMLEYTTAGAGRRFGLIVHHTDAEREWAYDRASHVGRLERGLDEAPERGWIVVDMKTGLEGHLSRPAIEAESNTPGTTAMQNHAYADKERPAPEAAIDGQHPSALLGDSDAFRYLLFRINEVAPTSATILLLGETGSGKTLIAREIHQRSAHRAGRFVSVNCAALPSTLLESELFGHESGALHRREGAADWDALNRLTRGTNFVGRDWRHETSNLQAKLLRVLQERRVRTAGIRADDAGSDVRVIAASNRDLEEEVRVGKFRRDLFFRLSVFPVTVPPLRERRRDIRLLALHFVERLARRESKRIDEVPEAVLDALERHHWPGNVRELENVLERAVITSRPGTLRLDGTATLSVRRARQRSDDRRRAVASASSAVARWVAGRGPYGSSGRPGAAPEHVAQPNGQAWPSPPGRPGKRGPASGKLLDAGAGSAVKRATRALNRPHGMIAIGGTFMRIASWGPLVRAAIASFAFVVAASPALAQLNTQHVKGTSGLKGGSQPPPGGYVVAPLLYFYSTDTVRNRDGDRFPVSANVDASLFAGGYAHITTKKILGGTYGFSVAPGRGEQPDSGHRDRPEPGRGHHRLGGAADQPWLASQARGRAGAVTPCTCRPGATPTARPTTLVSACGGRK